MKLMIIITFFFTMCYSTSTTFSIFVKTPTDEIIELDVENTNTITIDTLKIQIEAKENILRYQYTLKFEDEDDELDDDLALDDYNFKEKSIILLIYTEEYLGWKEVINAKCNDFDNLSVVLVHSQEECQKLAKKQKSLVFHWKNDQYDGKRYECKVCHQAQPLDFLANETETAGIITYVYFGGYEYFENSRLTNIITENQPEKRFDAFRIDDWYRLDNSDHDHTFGFFRHSAFKNPSLIL